MAASYVRGNEPYLCLEKKDERLEPHFMSASINSGLRRTVIEEWMVPGR
jgi:hypothetical protein